MSIEHLQAVIRRAIAEPEFREWLARDSQAALEGYELTAEEAEQLKGLSAGGFDADLTELEQRVSRAGLQLQPPVAGHAEHFAHPQPFPESPDIDRARFKWSRDNSSSG